MILAILQARVSSTRLPGKVLMPILGVPMILLEIERIRRSKFIDKLIVATSICGTDDPLENLCKEHSINCFRGELEDVLDRFYHTALQYHPEHIVRLTGDCPLIDPSIIDQVISFYMKNNYDYAGKAIEQTFPDGLDVEVLRFSCLKQAWEEAVMPSEREHVTPYIHKNPELFSIGHYKNSIDLSNLRWTVDEPLDFELITKIYESIYPDNPKFSTQDILCFLEKRPEFKYYNTKYQRNNGYQKSIINDEDFIDHDKYKES